MRARALIGTSDAIEAEFSYRPGDGSEFCFAEMVDGEVIAVSGRDTLEAAEEAALYYGFERNQLEYYGIKNWQK